MRIKRTKQKRAREQLMAITLGLSGATVDDSARTTNVSRLKSPSSMKRRNMINFNRTKLLKDKDRKGRSKDKECDDYFSDPDDGSRYSFLRTNGFSSRSVSPTSLESKNNNFHSRRSLEGIFPLEFPSISRHMKNKSDGKPKFSPRWPPASALASRSGVVRGAKTLMNFATKKKTSGNIVQLGDNSGIANKYNEPPILPTYSAALAPDTGPASGPDTNNTVGLGLALGLEDELLLLPKEIQEGESKQYEQASRGISDIPVKDDVSAADTSENVFLSTANTTSRSNAPENSPMPLDSKGKDTGKGKEKAIDHSIGCTRPISPTFPKLDGGAGTSTLFQGFCTCAVRSLCHVHTNSTAISSNAPPRPTNREYSESHGSPSYHDPTHHRYKASKSESIDCQCQWTLITKLGAQSQLNYNYSYDHDQSIQLAARHERLPPIAITISSKTSIDAGSGRRSAAVVGSSHMHAYAGQSQLMQLQHYHCVRGGYNHDGAAYGGRRLFASAWTNVACHIVWDKSQFNAHSAKIAVKNHDDDTCGDFEGHDTTSIFSKSASLEERFDGVHSWNSRIELPMQRYHLPLIGRILSPGDEGLCIGNIPPSSHVIEALSTFLFQSRVFTPPSLVGEQRALDSSPSQSDSAKYATFTKFGPLRKKISDWLLVNLDFALACSLISHWFGFSSSKAVLKKDTPPLDYQTLKQQSILSKLPRERKMNLERGVISNPYQVFPRRLWDLKVNRVIPTYLLMLPWTSGPFPDYVAISHSWVEASEREYIYSPINGNSWAIPIPKGTDFHHIRNEVLGHFPSIQYCWLDVLCLRQPPSPNDQTNSAPLQSQWLEVLELGPDCHCTQKHEKESLLDIPTIGNIYKGAAGVLRYLNGLGKVFRQSEWDHENHWLNRSWTLQESIGLPVHGGLCESCINPLNTISPWRGTCRPLRDCLEQINQILEGMNDTPSIMALIREMSQRFAAQEIDKIAGLSYLLHFRELPTYSKDEETEDAWERCLKSAPATIIAELFFNCPFSGLFDILPTWQEVTSCSGALAHLHMPTKSSIEIFRKKKVQILNPKRASNQVFREIRFFGHLLHGCITKNNPKDENYYFAAHARPRAQFPDMVMTLKFFLGYQVEIKLSDDEDTMYQLFTHSLTPCSSWVVLNEGTKIGVLCSDENFGVLHMSEIIEEGLLVVDTGGSIEVFGRD